MVSLTPVIIDAGTGAIATSFDSWKRDVPKAATASLIKA